MALESIESQLGNDIIVPVEMAQKLYFPSEMQYQAL
jgi:hypothetical protein